MSDIHPSSDVLIVGAGPTGLTLAHELLRHGIQVRLIEKELTTSQDTKALGIWPRTLELFARTGTGIVEEMLSQGVKTPAFNIWSSGKRLARLDFAHHITGPYSFALMIPQPVTEALLTRHVEQLGGRVERGTELVSLTQQEAGVEVVLRHANGQEEVARAGWLVGCDGASSTVRHLLGASFVGETFEQSFVTGNVRIQWNMPPGEAYIFLHRGNFIAFFPLPEAGRYRVIIAYQPGEVPEGEVTLEEIQRDISAYGPGGTRASEPFWLSRFVINQRKVEKYVFGRALLAGDAAHIHTVVGAQGMNTGIHDAFNLAWKLALVAQGRAKAQVLESYGEEREHVSKELLAATGWATRFALLQPPLLTGARDFLVPLISPLPLLQQRLATTLAELNVSYRHSSLVHEEHDRGAATRLHAGDRAPDGIVQVAHQETPHHLFEFLSGTRHTLFIFSREANAQALNLSLPTFQDLIESYQIIQGTSKSEVKESIEKQLYDPDGSLAHRYGLANEGLVLIRPDGYIGFHSQAIEGEHLHRYLQSLFLAAP